MRIKKLCLLFVLFHLLSVPQAGFAQSTYWGVKGGLNFTNFWGVEFIEMDIKNTGAFGAFLNFPVKGNLSFQPEILLTFKGAVSEQVLTDESGNVLGVSEIDYKITYIELPLLAFYTFETSKKVKPFIMAGPAVSFKIDASVDLFGSSIDFTTADDVDFSILFGGGITYNRMLFDVRYDLSFVENLDSFKAKNNVLSFMLGFRFR